MTDWIDVRYREPGNERPVIVCFVENGDRYVTSGQYFSNGAAWYVGGEYMDVIYWMDFPEPPRDRDLEIQRLGKEIREFGAALNETLPTLEEIVRNINELSRALNRADIGAAED